MDTRQWEVEQYAKLIDKILAEGQKRDTRAGPAYSVFGEQITINIENEFPLLRGRKMFYKPVLGELAAFFRGPKNIEDFKKFGCNYWDEWGEPEHKTLPMGLEPNKNVGDINVDYGNAWIDFNGVNQLDDLINKLKTNPSDRRLIISGWRPDKLAQLSLPCCHMLYQWYVRDNKYLDMIWYQRSVDTMVGLPSDIILCAAWNIILAQECGYKPGVIKLILGDTHIYANHLEGTLDYLRQIQNVKDYSNIHYNIDANINCKEFVPSMIQVGNYFPEDAIKFKLNV